MITEIQPSDALAQRATMDHNHILLASYIDYPKPNARLLQDSSGNVGVYHPDTGFCFANPNSQNLAEWGQWLKDENVILMAGELNSHFNLLKAMGELPNGDQLGCRFELQHFGTMAKPLMAVPEVKQATMADLERLVDFYEKSEDMQRSRENLAERLTENVVVYREVDGDIVAAALTHRHTHQMALIGGVYTVPEQRGKSYGKECVQTLCALLQSLNLTPCLFYEQNNQAAANLYQKLGFDPLSGWIIIELVYELPAA